LSALHLGEPACVQWERWHLTTPSPPPPPLLRWKKVKEGIVCIYGDKRPCLEFPRVVLLDLLVRIEHSHQAVAVSTLSPLATSTVEAWVRHFITNEPIGLANLNKPVFAGPIRTDIMHRVVVYELAKKRLGLASAKTRSEVRGSGRKIRPQKGQGQARAGDRRSPVFRGGAFTCEIEPLCLLGPSSHRAWTLNNL
jgi:hypothetical protein